MQYFIRFDYGTNDNVNYAHSALCKVNALSMDSAYKKACNIMRNVVGEDYDMFGTNCHIALTRHARWKEEEYPLVTYSRRYGVKGMPNIVHY